MAKVRVVPTASRRPGKCAVSAETTGPFLDTGKDVPRYGRIYLSVKWVKQRLSDAGELNEATEPSPEVGDLQNEVIELEDYRDRYEELVEAISDHIRHPEPEVREVEIRVPRDPSDEEIESWIERRGANHPVVRGARSIEKGSTEEWYSLYGDKTAVTPQEVADEVHEEPIHPDEPMVLFSVHDQEINLDVVLDQNIQNVLTFSEDKGEGFHAALARREIFVAEREGRKPRKGVLAPLGFWNDDEDAPLVPQDAQQGGGETEAGQDGQTPAEAEDNVPDTEPADGSDLGPRGLPTDVEESDASETEDEDEPTETEESEEEESEEDEDAFFTGLDDEDEEKLDDEYGEDVEDEETGEDE